VAQFVHGGDAEAMQQSAYQAWLADTNAGRRSILIADTQSTVTALNAQARHDRIQAGQVESKQNVALNDGTRASAGDLIITHHNNRRLQAGNTGWIRNGDRWTITKVHPDGVVTARRDGHRGASVILPADYVAAHVDLGYALTAHRSQGVTVDTSHVVVSEQTPRENLYVAMTRGRHGNTAYVATDGPELEAHVKAGADAVTAGQVLTRVLANSGAEPSAHQAQADEHNRWQSLAQLIPECEQIIADATAIHDAMSEADLIAELKARASGAVVGRRETIAGLVALPSWRMPHEHEAAIQQCQAAIRQRVSDLARQVLAEQPTWLADLGPRPATAQEQAHWHRKLAAVVTYRDTYGVTDPTQALGQRAHDPTQRARQVQAARALHEVDPSVQRFTLARPRSPAPTGLTL